MKRTSDKHAPYVDDQLDHEQQALLRGTPDEGRTEPRRAEASAPDEPGIGLRPEVEEPAGDAPPQSEVEARAALGASFPPSMFPAHRPELQEAARAAYASDDLVAALERVPDRRYETVGDLWDEIRGPGAAGPAPS